MAHLTIEYSANLEGLVDMTVFCDVARQAMVNTGVFPLAGIRVRAFCADHVAIGDGSDDLAFADMVLRMGAGRDDATRLTAMNAIYDALETWLTGRLIYPFALSLELTELNAPFTMKRLNTIRPALLARGYDNV
jgi:5-carboxymethyl-2-hydroxymuconate isomerase